MWMVPDAKERSQVVAQSLPRGQTPRGRVCVATWERSDMKGTRDTGPRHLASQPLLFGSVELMREVLAGAFLNEGHIIL